MDIFTVKTFAINIDRAEPFVRRAIDLGKIEAERVGGRWLIPGKEARRFKEEPFKISRKEMLR